MSAVSSRRLLLHNDVFKLIVPRNRAFAELQKRRGVVNFEVPMNYSKPQIKAYLYQLYGIKPLHVATQITHRKPRTFLNLVQKKQTVYREKARKIAYITLHDNEEWSPRWGYYEEDDEYRNHYGIPIPKEESESGDDANGNSETSTSTESS